MVRAISNASDEPITETPDRYGAYPRLSEQQIELLAQHGERRSLEPGNVLFREGDLNCDFFVVLDGYVANVERYGTEQERLISVHGPGRFLGELSVLTGQPSFFTAVARTPGEVLAVTPDRLRQVVAGDPALGDLIVRAFLLRRSILIELGVGVKIIGSRYSADARRLRDFVARNRIPHTWIDLEEDTDAEQLLTALHVAPEETPIVICHGTQVLRNPTNAELAAALGLRKGVTTREGVIDLVVVGGGPAGLAASVYGASEGLSTVLLEAVATGGQAGTSPRIENYLGFPSGLSGSDLAERAVIQAEKFGVRIVVPADARSLGHEQDYHVIGCADGEEIATRVVVVATGARYRKLDVPRLEEFEGVSVHYAATQTEVILCRNRNVVVVGGGNSAGQASITLSELADKVWLVVRGEDLGESMSRYLVDRIERNEGIEVLLHTEVKELVGEAVLAAVVVEDNHTGDRRTLPAGLLFVFIGAVPCTPWLAASITLDRHGFVLTGRDLEQADSSAWPVAARPPLFLETSRPGVFAAGDVRSGSIKRVAAGAGEGAMSVALVHRYLAGLV